MNFKELQVTDNRTHHFCLECKKENIKTVEKEGKEYYWCENCQKYFERAIIITPDTLFDVKPDGTLRHFSIGAMIKKDNKYLLFKRRKFPFVWVNPAGHLYKNENPEIATIREVEEETGLRVKSIKLLFEEELASDPCRRGVDVHYWRLYLCECEGMLRECSEAEPNTLGWYKPDEIAKFELSNPTKHFFKKMGVI